MSLKTGDLLLKKARGLGKIIGCFSKSQYSHVAIVYDYPVIVHSYWRGFNFWDAYHIEPYDVYEMKGGLNKREKRLLQAHIKREVQKNIRYDYKQLLAYSYYAVFGGENKFNSPNQYICTEAVDILFKKLGYNLFEDRPVGDLMLNHIVNSRFIKRK